MKIEAHLITFNEEAFIAYALRHYQTFCDRIVVHDAFSTDGTREIAKKFGVDVIGFDTGGKINDLLNKQLKNAAWRGTDADWVICADADELIYFPAGVGPTLDSYAQQGVAVVKPYGWEMLSDVFPTCTGQVYDEIKMGGKDDVDYAKPILFSPKRIHDIDFGCGAHVCTGHLQDGTPFANPVTPNIPSTYLLHFHHIRPIEEIAREYDETRQRYSDLNKQYGWGPTMAGSTHACEKRAKILATLQRVIP
jgi:hypothetical protein